MSSDKNDKFYCIWDNVTNEGLSKYSEDHSSRWEWDGSIEDFGAIDFHVFESQADAEKAVEALTKSFLKHDATSKIDFVIYELTHPKTVYRLRELRTNNFKSPKKSKKPKF